MYNKRQDIEYFSLKPDNTRLNMDSDVIILTLESSQA